MGSAALSESQSSSFISLSAPMSETRAERRARILEEQRQLIDDATDSSEASDFDDFDSTLLRMSSMKIQHANVTISSASSPSWMRSTRSMRDKRRVTKA